MLPWRPKFRQQVTGLGEGQIGWHSPEDSPFSEDEVSRLRAQIDEVLRGPKYIKMAELAEL